MGRPRRPCAARRRWALAGLAGAVLASATAAAGATDGGCPGRDLLPRLREAAPERAALIDGAADALPFGRGRLFKVVREGRPPSFLFGTTHSTDPRATAFSEATRAALKGAKVVALELEDGGRRPARDASPGSGPTSTPVLVAEADRRPETLLDPADLDALLAAGRARRLPDSAARTYKAGVLALILDTPDCPSGPAEPAVADALLSDLARDSGVRVVGLETLAELVAAVDGLPGETERELLRAMARLSTHAADMNETTLSFYAGRRGGSLVAWMRMPGLVPELGDVRVPPDFLDRLIDGRTARMRDRALPLLEVGGALIAVGAAHLPGEAGLARLLEQAGYEVETVE